MRFFWMKILLCLLCFEGLSLAAGTRHAERDKLAESTRISVRNRLLPLLNQYCGEACMIINVDVDIQEKIPEVHDLGFESLSSSNDIYEYFVDQIIVHVQIDRRITQKNREKLNLILNNHIRNFGNSIRIDWVMVELPKIGQGASTATHLRDHTKRKVENAVGGVIEKYCPNSCILSDVRVSGTLITPDEADAVPENELVSLDASHTLLKIDDIEVDLSIDENLPENSRNNILSLMKARTRFVSPVQYKVKSVSFPESWEEKRRRESLESSDPYGLEKLRRMLTMFRELAGTKEIISRSESKETASSNSAKEVNENEKNLEEKGADYWIWYLLIFVTVLGILAFVFMRFNHAGRDAKAMIQAIHDEEESKERSRATAQAESQSALKSKEIREQLEYQNLRDELVEIFVNQPKVAQATFGRLLQEEGVEEAAKYVHIFGKIIVFELLSDVTMRRNLYELSEFYHKTNINLDITEKINLLENLKRKVTANEIRVLTRQTIEQFDFIEQLDPNQIFALMRDEAPQVQSIILTQVSRKSRKSIFEMFEGKDRINLMAELCKADAIPKEYLYNVAMALSRKVLSKPEFDTHSLKSSDVILELMEKASLSEQKVMMKNLLQTNAEAARAIKMRLVTLELLPYLKGGHLLELILGLEFSDLLTFLRGCPEHIQGLLLSNAPEELAESWREELEIQAGADEETYRLIEMKILQKIRHLNATGAVNLLEINDMIFSEPDDGATDGIGKDPGILDENHLIA